MKAIFYKFLILLETRFKTLSPQAKRLLWLCLVLGLLGGEILWEGIQEKRYQQSISSLQTQNRQLKQRLHLMIRMRVAQEVEFLKDSFSETPKP